MSFSPGPWVVDRTVALGAYGVWTEYATHPGADGTGYQSEVCSVFRGNESDFDQETRNANAKLIAAAPDLLAKLQKTASWLRMLAAQSIDNLDMQNFQATAADIQKVIDKAIGANHES